MNVKTFLGWLLNITGGLFLMFAGGCGFFFMFIEDHLHESFTTIVLFSSVPFFIGCGMITWGFYLLRDENHSDHDDVL